MDTTTLTYDSKTESGHQYTFIEEPSRVSYHHSLQAPKYHFGVRHPMKPFRLMLTDHLVFGYNLHLLMDLYSPPRASSQELMEFHNPEYIEFLERISPETASKWTKQFPKFNIGDDCPIFDGMYDFATIYAGCSLDASRKLVSGLSDIAINWSGGLHHAKKSEPSGFCYVNDIVLGILNLLRVHPRVLYIDIDVHHGDGVQEAFYLTDRVMTLSFHKYNGEYFPGTGNYDEVGLGRGKHFALNVPLRDGIDDDSYIRLFKSIVEPVISTYQPSAIVQQCGADSLGGDRLGRFNLNIKAHTECVKFVKSFGLPMLVVGGGGYTPRNVSRLWTNETAMLLGVEPNPKLPSETPFLPYFGPDYSLHPSLSGRVENDNTRAYLDSLRSNILQQLRYLNGAPSVQFNEIPDDPWRLSDEEEKEIEDLNESERQQQEMKDEARMKEQYVD